MRLDNCCTRSTLFAIAKPQEVKKTLILQTWYSRPELNWDQRFRKPLLYPFELREPSEWQHSAMGWVMQTVCGALQLNAETPKYGAQLPTARLQFQAATPLSKLKKLTAIESLNLRQTTQVARSGHKVVLPRRRHESKTSPMKGIST